MKPINKTILFIVTLALLCQCDNTNPDPNINIPDNNFLNALIDLGVDTNGDGKISPAEAKLITSLEVFEKNISDLTGIEEFINLDTLICWGNKLTSLNVSNNTALKILVCDRNMLTDLDVSYNTVLTELWCRHNLLSSLNVSNNQALVLLNCQNTRITSLDVSNNIGLRLLYLNYMASLNKVCVWEMPFPPAGVYVDTTGSPNVYFTTDCN